MNKFFSFVIFCIISISLVQSKYSNGSCGRHGDPCVSSAECCNSVYCNKYARRCIAKPLPTLDYRKQKDYKREAVNRFSDNDMEKNPVASVPASVTTENKLITKRSTCAANGEYCLRHSDCCSKSCLSFTYKCITNNQLELQLAQNANREEQQTSLTDLVNRFSGNEIQKKPESSQVPVLTENRISIPSVPSTSSSIASIPATTSSSASASGQCTANGNYCLNHWECCSNSCLSFAYRCVPSNNKQTQDQFSLIWMPAERPQIANPKPIDVPNRFGTNSNSPTTIAEPSQKCAKHGEYCVNSWDCCSNRCLSFSYKCVENFTNTAPVVGPSIHTVVKSEEQKQQELMASIDDIVNRFGGGDTVPQTVNPAPIQQQSISPIPNNGNVNRTCKAIGNHCRNSDDCCSLNCNRNSNICHRPYPTVEIYNQANGQSNSNANHITQCLPNGLKCLENAECCTARCHGFLHKCVT